MRCKFLSWRGGGVRLMLTRNVDFLGFQTGSWLSKLLTTAGQDTGEWFSESVFVYFESF